MNVDSSSRIRSGLAWARCSDRNCSGSILRTAVIVEVLFESVVEDHSKDHAMTAFISEATRSPGYPNTTLPDATQSLANLLFT